MKKILDAVKEDLKLKKNNNFIDCGFDQEKEKPLLNLDSKNLNNPESDMQYYKQQFLGDCWLIAAFGILNKNPDLINDMILTDFGKGLILKLFII
jgi:hypothetical protein